MNRKIFSYVGMAAVAAVAGLTGCSEEQTFPAGEGTVFLSTRVNSDVIVESRAETEEELAAAAKIWIYSTDGVVRKYNGISEVPAGGIKLISGNYTVKAWAGKSEYASFDSRWFAGEQDFVVEAGKSKAVEVVCKVANVVASVNYSDYVKKRISDYVMTVSHKDGSLTFEGDDVRKGYYMMPEGVTSLDYVLTFTTDGEEKTARGTIADVEPAHEYVLNVTADAGDDPSIDIDDKPVGGNTPDSTPPTITGFGFDLGSPVIGESGSIGSKSIYVCATSAIAELELSGLPGVEGFERFNFIHADTDRVRMLAEAGISHQVEKAGDGQMIKVTFDSAYLNSLSNSEEPYVIGISATDEKNKTSVATLTLRISGAPVVTGGVVSGTISYTSARVSAVIAKDGVESAGFEYAKIGTDDWKYVESSGSSLARGQTIYATISDLDVCAAYKYRAVINHGSGSEYCGDEVEFSTINGPQLPNAGLENWYKSGKVMMPMGESQGEGWDTGNHGSSTMSVNITNSTTSFKHGGTYGAELKSQFVGLGIIGKFAAGNLFYGKYIATDGTDGIVGFGRPFDFPDVIKPTAIRLWVKYQPTNNWKGDSTHKPASGYDEGHIFVALFDAPDSGDSDSANHGKYGYVVRTKNATRLFDKDASNVMAYGERVFTESTPGNDLVEITIPLDYKAGKADAQPKLIAVVCTASKYGDYFEGGEGTTMYVDDVEIIYGKK